MITARELPVYLYAMEPCHPDLPVWISATNDVRRSAGHIRRGCPVEIDLVGAVDLLMPITYSDICDALATVKQHGNWFGRSPDSSTVLEFIRAGDTTGLARWLARPVKVNQ